jgi:hypothetical protein
MINVSERYANKTVICPKCSAAKQMPWLKVKEEVIDFPGAVEEVTAPVVEPLRLTR